MASPLQNFSDSAAAMLPHVFSEGGSLLCSADWNELRAIALLDLVSSSKLLQ